MKHKLFHKTVEAIQFMDIVDFATLADLWNARIHRQTSRLKNVSEIKVTKIDANDELNIFKQYFWHLKHLARQNAF